jgi:hypothetical protein
MAAGKKSPFIYPSLALLCAAAGASADADLSVLNLPKAGTIEMLVLLLVCFAVLVFIALFEVFRNRFERDSEKRAVENRFADNARRFGLVDAERRLLRGMVRHSIPTDANEIFESLTIFEQCVEGEVSEALSYVKKEEDLEELEAALQSIRKKLHFTMVDQGLSIVSTRNLTSGQGLWLLGPKKTILGEAAIMIVQELYFTIKITEKDFGRLPAFESVVRIAFTRKGDGIYGVEAPLVSFDPAAGIIKCRHTLKFKRNQLRQDVRVETDMMVNIRLASSIKPVAGEENANFMAKMTDISGGGFAFTSERRMSPGDTVTVTASSSKLVIGGVEAKIIGVTQNRNTQKYHHHAQFVNIEFAKKEKIIKYVFNRLRELTLR